MYKVCLALPTVLFGHCIHQGCRVNHYLFWGKYVKKYKTPLSSISSLSNVKHQILFLLKSCPLSPWQTTFSIAQSCPPLPMADYLQYCSKLPPSPHGRPPSVLLKAAPLSPWQTTCSIAQSCPPLPMADHLQYCSKGYATEE